MLGPINYALGADILFPLEKKRKWKWKRKTFSLPKIFVSLVKFSVPSARVGCAINLFALFKFSLVIIKKKRRRKTLTSVLFACPTWQPSMMIVCLVHYLDMGECGRGRGGVGKLQPTNIFTASAVNGILAWGRNLIKLILNLKTGNGCRINRVHNSSSQCAKQGKGGGSREAKGGEPVVAWRKRNFLLPPKILCKKLITQNGRGKLRLSNTCWGAVECVCVVCVWCVCFMATTGKQAEIWAKLYPPYWPYNVAVAAAAAAFLERQPQSLQYKLLCGSKLMPANFAECCASTG